MKFKLNKQQWLRIGHAGGWIKTATMSLHVVGLNRDSSFDTIMDIANALNNLLFGKLMDKTDKAYWDEFHSVGMQDTITIDGTNPDTKIGTINFYLDGIKQDRFRFFINSIYDYLNQNGIKTETFRLETSNMYNVAVARIPIVENKRGETADKPLEVQMANTNAHFIFKNVLGYTQDLWDDGTFDANELLKRINYYEGETKLPEGNQNQSAEISFEDMQNEDIMSGRAANSRYNEAQVRERLAQIKKFCEWAISHGHTKLWLG